jgi:hypothetical protein
VYAYLCRVMYNRRNKFDPLWNSLIVAGIEPPHAGASSEVRVALLICVSEMFCGKVRRVCIAPSAFVAWSSLARLYCLSMCDPLLNSLVVAGIEPPHAGASSGVRVALLSVSGPWWDGAA